jgi:hypothetical protein
MRIGPRDGDRSTVTELVFFVSQPKNSVTSTTTA